MVTLKKLKELKQIKRDNKVIYNLLNTIIGECEQTNEVRILTGAQNNKNCK